MKQYRRVFRLDSIVFSIDPILLHGHRYRWIDHRQIETLIINRIFKNIQNHLNLGKLIIFKENHPKNIGPQVKFKPSRSMFGQKTTFKRNPLNRIFKIVPWIEVMNSNSTKVKIHPNLWFWTGKIWKSLVIDFYVRYFSTNEKSSGTSSSMCSPRCKLGTLGFFIGLLAVCIPLAVILVLWLRQ